MKNLNFLSKNRGFLGASQSNDIGFDCRSTVVRPSFDRRSTLLKMVAVLVMVFTLGVGQMRGADQTVTWTATSGALGTIGATSQTNQTGNISTGSYSWNYTRTLYSGSQYAPSWVGGASNFIQLGKNGCVENIEFTTSAIPGTIKTVSIVCSSYNGAHKVNISVGSTSYVSNKATPSGQSVAEVKNSTTGSSSGAITISLTEGSRYVCIKSISVIYNNDGGGGGSTCATPTFSPAAGSSFCGSEDVSISCATGGATIRYTTDGSTPTGSSTTYSTPIHLTSTTTIKAKAFKDGYTTSSEASATYTNSALTTMDAIFSRATAVGSTETATCITFNNWVVSGASSNGKNIYVTDGTKGFIIYGSSDTGFKRGDILSGTVSCTILLYNGAAELKSLTTSTTGLTVTKGGSVSPITVDASAISALTGVNTGCVITTTGECGSCNSTKQCINGAQLFNQLFSYTTPTNGTTYTVTGVYLKYNSIQEILPLEDLSAPAVTCTLHDGAGGSTTTNMTQGSGTLPSGAAVAGWDFQYWCVTDFADSDYGNHGTTYNSGVTTPAQANLYAVYYNSCTFRYSTQPTAGYHIVNMSPATSGGAGDDYFYTTVGGNNNVYCTIAAGTTVTLHSHIGTNSTFASWLVTKSGDLSTEVTLSPNATTADNVTFVMPSYNIDITANFCKDLSTQTLTINDPTGTWNATTNRWEMTVTWNAVPGATSYEFTCVDNSSSTTIISTTNIGNVTSYDIPTGLRNNHDHTVTVKAITTCNATYKQSTKDFKPKCEAPTVSNDGLSATATSPTSISVSGGKVTEIPCEINAYGYVYNTTGTPTWSDSKVTTDGAIALNTQFGAKTIDGLTPGTTYYIRPAVDAPGYYAYGSTVTVTTPYAIVLDKNNSDGGSADGSALVLPNATSLTNITAPSARTGYTLEGYYTTSGTSTKIATTAGALQSGITVGGNTWTDGSSQWKRGAGETFYAKWSAHTYSVVFNRNGGTGGADMANQNFTYGVAENLTTCTYTKDGYNFSGWATSQANADAGTVAYTDEQSVSNLTTTNSGTVNLYAVWTEKTYTNYRTTCSTPKTLDYITFTDPTKLIYLVGETVNTAGAVVTAHYTDGTTGIVTAATTWTAPSGALSAGLDQNLTASYTEGGLTKTATHAVIDVYAVTLQKKDEDGGAITGEADVALVVSLSNINELSASASGQRYTFKEWQVTNGTLSSTSSLTPTITSVTGAITVTAVYYKPITVTWHAGGNVFSGPSEYSRGWATQYPDPSPDPEDYGCDGKIFYGWTRTANYDNASTPPTLISSGEVLTSDEDFYAVFAVQTGAGTPPTWTVTSFGSVSAGTYLIACSNKKVFNGEISSGHGQVTAASFSHALSGSFSEDAPVGACELTLSANSSGWNMYNAELGYLYCNGTSSGSLRWDASAQDYWFNSNSQWSYHGQVKNGTAYVGLHDYSTSIRTYSPATTAIVLLKKTAAGSPATYSDFATSCTCKSFSFHTGTGTDNEVKATIHEYCFEQVDASTTWKIDNYVIPNETKFFVGYQDEFKTSGLGTSSRSVVKQFNADESMYFEYTKTGLDGSRPSVGNATGAVGTLRIWSDSNWDNCHVGFDPNGYIFKLGSTYYEMSNSATLDGARYKETEVITLTSTDISGKYQVNIAAVAPNASTGVASRYTENKNLAGMGVKTGASTWRNEGIKASDANTKGFFRIDKGDGGATNWNAHWVPIWELTFDLKGGTGSIATTPAYVSVEDVSKVVTIPNVAPTKSGYRFLGWSNTDGGGVNYAAGSTHNVTLSGNKTVYAVWAQEFTVTYAGNGGTTSCEDANNYIAGETVTVCASTPTKDCSTFTGWLGDNGVGTKAESATFSMPAANVTLTAQWNTTTYALTYKDQDDAAYSGSNSASLPAVHTCGVATVLVDGERAGYRFDGWFTNSACTGDPITSIAGNGISSPTTLYAKWTASHTFTFKDYENATIHTIGQVEGGNVVMPSATADCGLWTTFVGWVESAVAETTTEPSVIYREGDIFVAGNSDKEFKALYSKHEGDATVSYHKVTSGLTSGTYIMVSSNDYIYTGQNSGSGTTDYATVTSVTQSDGVVTSANLPNTAKEITVRVGRGGSINNKFAMQIPSTKYLSATGGNYLNSDIASGDVGDAYVWKLDNGTDSYGKSGSEKTGTAGALRSTTNTTRVIQYNSSRFACYENSQANYVFLYRKKVAGTTYYATNPASCIVPTQVVVSYNDNKSHAGDQTISGMPSGTTLTFDPYPNFASYTVGSAPDDPTGYHFAGWNTSADGSGSNYTAGASVTTFGYVENITLYAKWERVYSVTLYDNGEERTTLVEASAGAGVTLPSGNNCGVGSAFAFEGWTESAVELNADPVRPAAATLHAAGSYVPTSDITLYSVYSKSVAGCEDFAAGVSGAYKMYNNATNDYALTTGGSSSAYGKGNSGTAEIFYIAYSDAKSAYTIRTSAGYLGWSGTGSGTALTKTNTTPYYWLITEGASGKWNFQPISESGRQFSGNNTTFQIHTNSTKYYIRLEKVAMTYYYNTAICEGAQITFHDGGGTISGTPTTPTGASWNSGTHVLSGLEDCDKITTFPTANYDGWTFVGWSTEDYSNSGKHVADYAEENASTDEPDGSIIYKTGGNSYTVLGGNIDLYPIFTRFPENEPFNTTSGGDYYIYYLDPSSDDGYGAPARVYAGEYSANCRYLFTKNCASATVFTFEKSGDYWTIKDGTKYIAATGGSDNLTHADVATNWTLSIYNGNQFDAVAASGRQISARTDGWDCFMNYYSNNIANNPTTYHRVYLGSCTERIFSSDPNPVPILELSGEPYVTSSVDQRVRATATMTLTAAHLSTSNRIKVTGTNLKFATSATDNPATPLWVDLTSGAANATIYVYYTPTSTEDGLENIIVTAQAYYTNTPRDIETTGTVHCRHLPADFVIAAKWNDKWYALPNTCSFSGSNTAGVLITVDNDNDPTCATYAPSTAKWGLRQTKEGSRVDGSYYDRLVFTERTTAVANSQQTLYNYNSAEVFTNATYTNYNNENPIRYEWIPATSNFKDYTLTNANDAGRPLILRNDGEFKAQTTNQAYDGKVRLLPATFFDDNVQIVEWKTNSVVIMYTGTETTAKAKAGSNTETSSQTLSSQKITHGIYEVTTGTALTSHTGENLILTFGSGAGKKLFEIPWIINGSSGATSGHDKQDVVILKNGKLTAQSTKYSFRNVYVYGGGKLKIASGTQLGVNNIILRAGGISTNGSGGSPTYEYVYPQVELGGTLTSTKTDIKYEYITDYDHWYHLCLPFDATLNSIHYPVEYYGDNVKENNTGSWIIERYDGATRATGNYDAWKDIESESATVASAGHGYLFWGAPKKVTIGGDKQRQKWGIQRMTMSIAAGAATTAETANKTIDGLSSYASVPGNSGKVNDQGWNLIGNPYLMNLSGLNSTSLKTGKLIEEVVGGNKTGHWVSNNDGVRYVTIPSDHFDTYTAQTMAWFTSSNPMVAGRAFFVQIDGDATAVQFNTADRKSLMPVWERSAEAEQKVDIETGIVLSDDDETRDEVNFWIKNDKTEAYEYNADYPKTPNNTNFNIYGVHEVGQLSWVAISPEIAEGSMAIGYQVPAAGDYTLSLSETYVSDKLEALYVTDHEVTPEFTTNLMEDTYSFGVKQAESNDTRFTARIVLKDEAQVPTDVGKVDGMESEHPLKFLYRDKLYILRNGVLYDATGKKVK